MQPWDLKFKMFELIDFLAEFFYIVVQFTIIYFVVNFLLGVGIDLFVAYKNTDSEFRDNIIKRLNEIVHRVEIEQQNDMYYWYDLDNKEFLAQGRNTEEIVVVLKQRFVDHIFVLNDEHIMVGPNFDLVAATPENMARVIDK
jgi:hypothetical protein